MNATAPKHHLRLVQLLAGCCLALGSGLLASTSHADTQEPLVRLAQMPLSVGQTAVPGNLVLTPSVEYPTVLSRANLNLDKTGNDRTRYYEDRRYYGYFSADFCYTYDTDDEVFRPVRRHGRDDHRCNQGGHSGEWSGNFLSWATTRTIDTFRLALTGGLRDKDTVTETWLRAARHPRNWLYPNPRIDNSYDQARTSRRIIRGATPFSNTDYLELVVAGEGHDFKVTHPAPETRYATRVSVCEPEFLEDFCVAYGNNYKPEGLLQRYSNDMRYSVFSYLNDANGDRDGGVLRATQKYIGPQRLTDQGVAEDNPNKEWDPATGVLIQNPDNITRALGISIEDSGVINYINKFGELNDYFYKDLDSVSELYYTAYRYLAGMEEVPEYTATLPNSDSIEQQVDNFPVITGWSKLPDPIQFSCQPNFILGIGDAYTHRDKNLPGNTHYRSAEPAMPAAVAQDKSVDVVIETNRVGLLEDLGNIGSKDSFSGRNNSAYIAGLAYFARTRDIRPDLPGTQTVATHWVDVMEGQRLEPPASNQYYLATKYGGMRYPASFNPEDPDPALIQEQYWHTNNEILQSDSVIGNMTDVRFKRPDNYYLAGQAEAMISSLESAFVRIVAEIRGSASSLTVDGDRLETGDSIYAASYTAGTWQGDLVALPVSSSGNVSSTSHAWSASAWLNSLSDEAVRSNSDDGRKIYTADATGSSRIEFTAQALNSSEFGSVGSASFNDLINYLRGDHSREQRLGGPFRDRSGRLGSIIHSSPLLVSTQNHMYHHLQGRAGDTYAAYVRAKASLPKVIYVGSNSGMLHAFAADNSHLEDFDYTPGQEIFAYVPRSIYERMHLQAIPPGQEGYTEHTYLVDGSPMVTDAYIDGGWKTILIGTLGAGGNGVFALDITNPLNPLPLWEYTSDHLGEGVTQAVLVKDMGENDDWSVILANGYNSAGDKARLIVLNAKTGALKQTLELPGNNNALTSVIATSSAAGGFSAESVSADILYAGDLLGNLWRFHYSGGMWYPSLGTLDAAQPLYRNNLETPQPITAGLAVGRDPDNNLMVFFGTGKYLEDADKATTTTQSIYGLIDRTITDGSSLTLTREHLLQQSITHEITQGDTQYRVVSDSAYGNTTPRGWYIDLTVANQSAQGERVINRPTLRAGQVIFTTLIPSGDICASGGSGWPIAIDMYTGGRIASYIDEQGQPVTVTITEDGVEREVAVSSIKATPGTPSNPVILADGTVYTSDSTGEISRFRLSTNSSSLRKGRISWRQLTP